MNAESNKGFAASPRQIGLGSREKHVRTRAAGHSRGHPPTCDKGKNHNEDTEQQVCLDQCVLCDDSYKAGLASARAHLGPSYHFVFTKDQYRNFWSSKMP